MTALSSVLAIALLTDQFVHSLTFIFVSATSRPALFANMSRPIDKEKMVKLKRWEWEEVEEGCKDCVGGSHSIFTTTELAGLFLV